MHKDQRIGATLLAQLQCILTEAEALVAEMRECAALSKTALGSLGSPVEPTPSPELLTLKAVTALTSLRRSTIYKRMAESGFPQPVRIGARRVAWRRIDLETWMKGLAR